MARRREKPRIILMFLVRPRCGDVLRFRYKWSGSDLLSAFMAGDSAKYCLHRGRGRFVNHSCGHSFYSSILVRQKITTNATRFRSTPAAMPPRKASKSKLEAPRLGNQMCFLRARNVIIFSGSSAMRGFGKQWEAPNPLSTQSARRIERGAALGIREDDSHCMWKSLLHGEKLLGGDH